MTGHREKMHQNSLFFDSFGAFLREFCPIIEEYLDEYT